MQIDTSKLVVFIKKYGGVNLTNISIIKIEEGFADYFTVTFTSAQVYETMGSRSSVSINLGRNEQRKCHVNKIAFEKYCKETPKVIML